MNVWLAEQHSPPSAEILGIFSDPVRARKVCQDAANEYFGEKNTPALTWLGDDGYCSASYHHPVAGMWLFQITRFTGIRCLVAVIPLPPDRTSPPLSS